MEQNIRKVALYCRVASAAQVDTTQIDYQRHVVRRFAEEQGLSGFKEYIDNGYGGHSLDRPALQQMIADIKAGNISTVVVKDVERLARNCGDIFSTINTLEKTGVTLLSATESTDDTPSGLLLHEVKKSIVELYSEKSAADAS